MKTFFGKTVGIELSAFDPVHLSVIAAIIIGSILIFVYRKKIMKLKFERKLAMGLAIFMLLWEIALYIWKIANGVWTWDTGLPIGLCAFALFIAIFALYFKKYSLFEIGYFWSFGAVASILFPDILYSFDRFRFYQFMIGHIFFFYLYMYMIFVYKWYPTLRSYKKSAITLIVIVVILTITSYVTDTNLMFLRDGDGSPFELFEFAGPVVYLACVMVTATLVMLLWYVPFIKINKKQQNKSQNQ